MFKRILVAVDGSKSAQTALEAAASLARESGAQLTICHVVDGGKASAMSFGEPLLAGACYDALEQEGRGILKDALDFARTIAPAVNAHLAHGAPIEEICSATLPDTDLIVMGTNGRGGLNKLIIGSVAEGVIRRANVPVLVIPLHAASRYHDEPAQLSQR
ncbi:MAG: universal stress protein [Vulcanimicrobiaceae bacterium]